MFKANYMDSNCLRCDKVVYPTDKIGPLKDYSFFHSGCFRCAECFSKLTLKSYYNNQSSNEDKEVYCSQVNLGTRSHPSPLRDIVTLFTVFFFFTACAKDWRRTGGHGDNGDQSRDECAKVEHGQQRANPSGRQSVL